MTKKVNLIQGWKIIFKYVAQYRKEFVAIIILSVVSALANGFVPYIIGRLFDAILNPSVTFDKTAISIPFWLFLILIWVVIQLIANTVDWIISIKKSKVGNIIYNTYLAKSVIKLIKLPLSFHKDKKTGNVFDKIQRSSNWLSNITENVLIDLTPQFLSVFVGLAVSFYIKPLLGLVILVGTLSYILVVIQTAKPAAKYQKRSWDAYGDAFGDAYDAISNVNAVKNATAEQHESRKIYKKFVNVAAKISYKIDLIWGRMTFYQRITVTITQLLVFIISIHFILNGEMSLGKLIALNGYAAMVFGPFVQLGYNWQTIINGLVTIRETEKILKTPPEIYTPTNVIILPEIKGNVEFKNVSFAYKKQKDQPVVLNDINFKIKEGEVVALVGESGVGKSTLVDLISGYYFASNGKVLIDDHNIKTLDLNFLRSHIAVVPQEVGLFNDTIKANIIYGAFNSSAKKIDRAAKEAQADEFINKFPKKYKQIVGERGIKLSVGQKQRVAIARAILRNPKILILDEPTSALDSKTEKIIEKALENLMKGRTTVIIAHRLSTVKRADKILVLDKGKIVEQGKHEQLIKIKNGIYRELYELQTMLR